MSFLSGLYYIQVSSSSGHIRNVYPNFFFLKLLNVNHILLETDNQTPWGSEKSKHWTWW